MSEAVTVATAGAAAGDPAPPQTPTVTHYQQIAANLAKAIDDMLALVPNFVTDAHPATKAFVRRRQNVPIASIATAIAAVDANPELQGVPGFDVTEARDSLQYIDAFRPMVDLLSAAKDNLAFNIESRGERGGWRPAAVRCRQRNRPLSEDHHGGIARQQPQARSEENRNRREEEADPGSGSGSGSGILNQVTRLIE